MILIANCVLYSFLMPKKNVFGTESNAFTFVEMSVKLNCP